MMLRGYELHTEMRGAHGGKHRHVRRRKTGREREEKKKKRKTEVAQQVVHTARWVPGAWRGWLRYQTAHTRGRWAKH